MDNSQLIIGMVAASAIAIVFLGIRLIGSYRKRRFPVSVLNALSFSPPSPLTIDLGSSQNVRVTSSLGSGNVTLTSSRPDVAVPVPATLPIAANAPTSVNVAIAAHGVGHAIITPSPGFSRSSTLEVNVLPVLSDLTPASGVPGAKVTLTGSGFDSNAIVLFGNQQAPTKYVSPTQLTVRVPNLPAGQTDVTVRVNDQTSQRSTFEILAGPTTLLFRTSGTDVRVFSYSPNTGFAQLHTHSATQQSGNAVVGIAFNGMTNVLRTSANDIQNFSLGINNLLSVAGVTPGFRSDNGAAIAAFHDRVVRACDPGLETYQLVSGQLVRRSPLQPIAGDWFGKRVAVDLRGILAVRGHTAGIDVYNVADLFAPFRIGSSPATGQQRSTVGGETVGVGVKFALDAQGRLIVVWSGPVGIDVYSLGPDWSPALPVSSTGSPSETINTAIVIDETRMRAVRVYRDGIEVYNISDSAAPQRISQRSGPRSTTGVGGFIVGDLVFRATNNAVEAYDISDPLDILGPVSITVPTSNNGAGLSGK